MSETKFPWNHDDMAATEVLEYLRARAKANLPAMLHPSEAKVLLARVESLMGAVVVARDAIVSDIQPHCLRYDTASMSRDEVEEHLGHCADASVRVVQGLNEVVPIDPKTSAAIRALAAGLKRQMSVGLTHADSCVASDPPEVLP